MSDLTEGAVDGATLQAVIEMLREGQESEYRALETLLLACLDESDVDLAAVEETLDEAIANHERMREELATMRGNSEEEG